MKLKQFEAFILPWLTQCLEIIIASLLKNLEFFGKLEIVVHINISKSCLILLFKSLRYEVVVVSKFGLFGKIAKGFQNPKLVVRSKLPTS